MSDEAEYDEDEDALDALREAARNAARHGFYADYLAEVTRVAAMYHVPANPDEDKAAGGKDEAA